MDEQKVMNRIAFAMSQVGTSGVPGLIRASHDPDSDVRLVAIRAIKFIGAAADVAMPDLIQLLQDPIGEVRLEAVGTLYRMGPKRSQAVTALIGAPNDSNLG